MEVEFGDGRIYTGWKAVPWLLLYSPLIVVMLIYALIMVGGLEILRLIMRTDKIGGWYREHPGSWKLRDE